MKWFALLLCAGPAVAENSVTLHVTYLGAPTEWCAQDQGVPFVGTMDGPDVLQHSGRQSSTTTITRRVGDEVIQMDVPVLGSYTTDSPNPLIGRLSAEFQGCDQPWASIQISGRWSISGDEPETGVFSELWLHSLLFWREPAFIASKNGISENFVGDRKFFASGPFEFTTTQTYAFEGEKEQQE